MATTDITALRTHRAIAVVEMAEGIVAEGTGAETAGVVAVEMEEEEEAEVVVVVVIEDLFSSGHILQIRSVSRVSLKNMACVGNVA